MPGVVAAGVVALGAALLASALSAVAPQAHAQPQWEADRRHRRPTDRLRLEQRQAIAWMRAHPGLGDDALAREAAALAGEDSPRARALRERIELERLRRAALGTRDLAATAQRIWELERAGIIDRFQWVADAGDWNKATLLTVEDVLYCRYNNCFCFVNFCAWLASDQGVWPDGAPRISHGAWMAPGAPGSRPLTGPPRVGEVVVNAHRMPWGNNEYGFQHTGIVVADRELVHLSSRDLRKNPVEDVFAPLSRTLWVGPFDWDGYLADVTPPAPAPAPPP